MNKIGELIRTYSQNEISLEDFQFRLEPLLGAYNFRSKDDERFINDIINQIEVIIYTIPKERHQEEVIKMFPRIIEYAETKDELNKS